MSASPLPPAPSPPLPGLTRHELTYELEQARPEDLPRLLEIEALCFAEPWPKEAFEGELACNFSRLCVAREQPSGDIMAFANWWLVADELHLLNLAVHPARRGRGLARRLLAKALEGTAGQNPTCMFLEVRPSNTPARGLYQSLGFHEVGRRPRYYPDGEDALLLRLDLMSK